MNWPDAPFFGTGGGAAAAAAAGAPGAAGVAGAAAAAAAAGAAGAAAAGALKSAGASPSNATWRWSWCAPSVKKPDSDIAQGVPTSVGRRSP